VQRRALHCTFKLLVLVTLSALALVSFGSTLVVLGLVWFYRTRRRAALLFTAIGAVALLLFGFLASRFALQWFGTLPFALDLRRFALVDLSALLVALGAGAAAVGLALTARRSMPVALGLVGLGGVMLLGAVYWASAVTAQALNAPPEAPAHPSLENIRVPDAFRVQAFAMDLQEPTALAFDDLGNLYYAELVDGNIVRLRDTDGDGAADEKQVFASGFANPRGLAWRGDQLYVSSRGQISTLRDTNGDGVADEHNVILDGLFSLDIQHSNNGIAFGPDGKLYIAIGGPRVGQLELKDGTYWYEGQPRDDWQFGGILVVEPDGSNPRLYARGLRNPYALAFGPDAALYATDNGDETIPVPDGDELNLIEQDADYGYPYFFGIPPPWSATVEPLVRFLPHTAPTGVAVYNAPPTAAGAFPDAYQGAVLAALYWHGRPGGYYREVVRVFEDEQDGEQVWKMRGFVQGLDRPTALAVGPDGALYIADMRGGKADPQAPGAIYRISR
jgi:glucose/arabinose dehydrogenase